MAILNEIFLFVLSIGFLIAGLCILLACGYFGWYWWRHPHTTDDKTEILEAINELAEEIRTMKKGTARIKNKVKKNE